MSSTSPQNGSDRRLLQLFSPLAEGLVVESAVWSECMSGHGHDMPWLFSEFFGPRTTQARVTEAALQRLDQICSGLQSLAAPAPALCPFLAVVDTLLPSKTVELKTWIGEELSLALMGPDGRYRQFHGHVFQATNLGSDTGKVKLRLGLASSLHFLTLRKNTRVFIQRTTLDIVSEVLSGYPQVNFKISVSQEAANAAMTRGVTTQYGESDAAFLARLLAAEGWNWHLVHAQEGGTDQGAAGQQKQCLEITDKLWMAPDLGTLRWQRPDLRAGEGPPDALTHLSSMAQVRSNCVTLGSWVPAELTGISAQARSRIEQGTLPSLETYVGGGERAFVQFQKDTDAGSSAQALASAELMILQNELEMRRVQGHGAERRLSPAQAFSLNSHPQDAYNQRYTVLSVLHCAVNNAPEAQAPTDLALEPGSYSQRFTAAAGAQYIVPPAPHPEHAKPVVHFEMAVVVGDEVFAPVTSNRDMQVRIQFPWQRGVKPLQGGLPGQVTPGEEPTGHAPGHSGASVWVRVAQDLAGPNWGSVFVPRHNTEVLVAFDSGDIDRPVVVGALHNAQDALPWPLREDVNHTGTLTGFQTQSFNGSQSGGNQWVTDSHAGQLRMRLATWGEGSPWTEFSVGHLIGQGRLGDARRGAWLGSGFLAHTDGWAVARAQEGMLLSTSARAASHGSAQSTQMDSQEAVGRLTNSQALAERMGNALGGLPVPGDLSPLKLLGRAIDPQQAGKFMGYYAGQETLKAKGNSRAVDDSAPVERFAQPHLVLQSASAAMFSSAGPMACFSGEQQQLLANSDIHVTSGQTIGAASGQTTQWHTQQGPMEFVTANADLSVEAHDGEMQIESNGGLTVRSLKNEIHITGKSRVELVCGASRIVLDGANVDYYTPELVVRTNGHDLTGGEAGAAAVDTLPVGLASWQAQGVMGAFSAAPNVAGAPSAAWSPVDTAGGVPSAATESTPSLYQRFDEQVVFKDGQDDAIEGRLRFTVAAQQNPDQSVEGDSPEDGETDRISTKGAEDIERKLRYEKFDFGAS